jgi:hypothetical protein
MDAERLSGGNTLIADRFNNRVIEVNESKGVVWQYAITNPFDADRLSNGNTLIVEYTNHSVIEINDSDEIVWQYGNGTSGSGVNQLNNPMDAERLANGNTLIADYANDRVIEVRTSDYDPAETDNGFTAASIVWEYGSNHPADAERLFSGSTLISEAGNNSVVEVAYEIDLLPTALEIPTLYDNMSNTIRVTILNNRTGEASSFNVSLSADGNPVDEVEVSGLGAGGSTVVSLFWTPSATGDFELCVTADCDFEVNESNETNNVLCENVTVSSFEYPCWNDTFDDETKIAGMQHVIVHEGDVKHDQKSHGGWESDSSLESGLGTYGSRPPGPAMAYNITGDGRWNLIMGGSYGYYWDGMQWISDSSLVAGLGGSSDPSPTIAYNITGDGRWNLIAGEYLGVFHGFYWNGTQWISNSSLVAGLGDVGSFSSLAIAFNITGDGRWNLISGSKSGTFCGWYWNGSQWISDSSLVAGLGDIGGYSAPVIAYNLTGDGRWNLISGRQYGVHGYYWNGTQWVSDSSVTFGLSLGSSWNKLAMGFNITGDGSWNLIGSAWDSSQYQYVFKGFGYRDGFIDTGYVKSVAIQPLARFKNWAVFNANDTVPAGTNITYKILDASSSTIMTVVDGQNISGITQTSIRLYAELTTNNTSYTPLLHDWGVCWETGDVDLMPTAIETPAELYANVTTIGAVIANHGDAHSGSVEFDVTLYANEVEVDSNRIVVNDMPPGWSTNVMFLGWAPPHAGTYNLTVIVDSNDEILEPNETNNSLAKEVTVLPSNVRRLTFDPSSSVSPGIATDSEGNMHLVRYDTMGEGSGLYYKKLAPDGAVLVDDKMASPGSGSRIAVDFSDNVHVVFNNATNSINVSYMKLDNLGNMLIEPKQVISGIYCGGGDWFPAHPCGIVVDGSGNVHVVACCNCGKLKHGDMQYLEYVKLDNDGNKLVNYTIEYLTTPGASGTWDCLGVPPSDIAVDSAGNAYTAYSKGSCGAYGAGTTDCFWPSCLEAYYVKIDGEGVHKQELTSELPGLPCPSLYPSVCVDSGDNKYVVWSQHNKTATFGYDCWGAPYRILHGFDFYLSKFDKSDNKVIDRKRLTFEDYPVDSGLSEGDTGDYYVYGVRRPIIATESGVIHAAWSVQDVISSFSPPGYISEPGAGEDNNMGYMAFDTSGDEITNKTLISLEGGNSWEPCIDAVQDGAHLVWTDNRDGNNEIYYAKTVAPPNRVFILAPPDKWTPQNVNATYTIGVMSTMSGSETFNLTLDNLDGAGVAELGNLTITLDPLSIGEVILNVTDADVGDYRVTVNATSQTNPGINASATITTSIIVPEPDLIVTAMDAYHNDTDYAPYFNIPNEVDVTLKNIGTAPAGVFNVSLYADGEFVDKKNVPCLGTDGSTLLQFKWTPTGLDCEDGGTPITYTLKAIADCDNDTVESDEANNESTTEETVYWAGYSADEHIDGVAWHGMLHGGLHYTTGDGVYAGLYTPGNSEDTVYSITLPAGASIELARLNVYYTWSKFYSTGVYPVMEVRITNTTGTTYLVPINASYNDRPCESPAIGYDYPFGNYVYDLTPYITGDGSYTVNVKNVGASGYSFCISAPGLVILYGDDTKPECEFWILEGADLLEGGHRGGAGNLDLSECICNATFTGDIDADKVDDATLGIVSAWGGAAWGDDWTSYYWFNDNYLGDGSMLGGYGSLYDKMVNGISMHVGSSNDAQVGVNVSDVTSYIADHDNTLSFGDDGDSMMAANAFLVVEHGAGRSPAPLLIYGWVNYTDDGGPANDSDVVITNLNTGEVLAVETAADSNYYQAVTGSHNVSVGDVLNFDVSNGNATKLNHAVTSEEMGDGCFTQNLTFEPGICGDVNDDGSVDMTDVMTLWYDIADYPYVDAYTISNAWAADVNCDGEIDMTDVMTLWYDIADYPTSGAHEVDCCG